MCGVSSVRKDNTIFVIIILNDKEKIFGAYTTKFGKKCKEDADVFPCEKVILKRVPCIVDQKTLKPFYDNVSLNCSVIPEAQ